MPNAATEKRPWEVTPEGPNLNRRSLLVNLGLAGMGYTLARSAAAAAPPPSSADGSATKAGSASFTPRGRFDLSNPADLKRARLKVLNSLDGSTTYFYSMTRHILCPPGEEPYPFHAEMELTTIQLLRDEGMDDDEAKIRAVFTRAPLDPYRFTRIESLHNPYTDKRVALKDTLFAGGGSTLSLKPDAPVSPIIQSDEPHYRMGDDIEFIMFDPRAGSGAFQPRIDTVVWRTNYDALMDPTTAAVEADYTFSAILKASVYPWSGIDDGDPAQMLTMKTGRKVNSLEALPREVHDTLVSQYPERV